MYSAKELIFQAWCISFFGVFLRPPEALTASGPINCYACMTPLPNDTIKDAKQIAKQFLSENYNLPTVSGLCEDTSLPAFTTAIPKVPCDSSCTKLRVAAAELRMIIRGCNTTLFKRPPNRKENACSATLPASICDCNMELCNSATTIAIPGNNWNLLPVALFLYLLTLTLS